MGEIGKPHGTGGEVYVVKISDDPHRFDPGSRLRHADGRELEVETARSHRDRFLVKFVGVDTRSEAEGLRGTLYVRSDQRRELEEAEYWTADMIGCRVVTVSGDAVGEVTDVIPGAAQDLLAIQTEAGEVLVPMVSEFIASVDIAGRHIVIDPPEGLIT